MTGPYRTAIPPTPEPPEPEPDPTPRDIVPYMLAFAALDFGIRAAIGTSWTEHLTLGLLAVVFGFVATVYAADESA